ncbi:MAG TPA: FRG domain-containing protein [Thermoanaerobaculia bacterium]|nr:FRG domain-containing protein [Thermoanaerobaculia bacterium]
MSSVFEELPSYASARHFVSDLRLSAPLWDGDDETHTGWIFRGQQRSEWPLLASIFRPFSRNNLAAIYLRNYKRSYRNVTAKEWREWVPPRTAVSASGSSRRHSRIVLQALAHAALVRDFVLLADRAGHETIRPDFLWYLTNCRNHRDALETYFRGDIAHDDLAAFAIAQHHGVPTALLDWTYNPLVAAFFAAEPLASAKNRTAGGSIAVWALRTQVFRHDTRELRRFTVPPGRVPFLDAQGGLFTWSPVAYEWVVSGRYPTVECLLSEIEIKLATGELRMPLLRKLVLDVAQIPDLLKILWREQVTRAHLMPTYDNVTASMRLSATWQEKAR